MDFIFGSSSPMQKAVDTATSELLLGPDWAANVEIFEAVNRSEDGGRDVLRAIARRLQHKNPTVVLLALELLSTCVNNCRAPFHSHVHKQEFLDQLVIVATKGQNSDVRDKALSLIESWSEAFRNHGEYPNFEHTYQTLKSKGVSFPARDMTSMAPVFTPASNKPRRRSEDHQDNQQPDSDQSENPLASCSPEYVARLKSEMQEVMHYVGLVKEMITAAESAEAAKKDETLRQLVIIVTEMQGRLTRIIVEIEHEQLLDLCIQVNEHIRVCLDWYKSLLSNQPYNPPELPIPKEIYTEHKSDGSSRPSGGEQAQGDILGLGTQPKSIIHVAGEADDGVTDEFESLALRRHQQRADEEVKKPDNPPMDEFEALALRDSHPQSQPAQDSDQQIKELEELLGLAAPSGK